jgi:hypothetical protein
LEQSFGSARAVRLDEIEPIEIAGGLYKPVRRLLGVRAFGINAYTARSAGDQLIEQHDELGDGSGHHEEAYIVVSGHARFTVGTREIEAPAGTVLFVPDISAIRSATALEDGTTAIVVGAPSDRPLPASPFEYWFVAEGPYRRGDYHAAIEIAREGLEQWPDHPVLHYQLACYHARAGMVAEALDHLAIATAGDVRAQGWARDDRDFDQLRDNPRFIELIGGP